MKPRVGLLISKRGGLKVMEQVHAAATDTIVGVVTLDDRADTRSAFDDIIAWCTSHRLPVVVARGQADAERAIADMAPTHMLVVGWYWLISEECLTSVPGGVLGLHFSSLPRYRGGSPVVWAIINRERSVGVSLFSLTTEMDAGDIWAQAQVGIEPDTYVGDALEKLETAAAALVGENISAVLRGQLRSVPQPETNASYGALRQPSDGRIDWTWDAGAIAAFVRAQSHPYPGAFTWWEGKRVTIWRARVDATPHFGPPGAVVRIAPSGVYVACGTDQPLVVESVQLDDGDEEPASRVIRSVKTRFAPQRSPDFSSG